MASLRLGVRFNSDRLGNRPIWDPKRHPPCFAVSTACHMPYGLHSYVTQWCILYGIHHNHANSESGNALQPALTCEADHMADSARHSTTRASTLHPTTRSIVHPFTLHPSYQPTAASLPPSPAHAVCFGYARYPLRCAPLLPNHPT